MDRRRGISFLRVSAPGDQVPETSTPDAKGAGAPGGSARNSPNQSLASSVNSLGISTSTAGNTSAQLKARSSSTSEFSPPQRRANGVTSMESVTGSPTNTKPLAADISREGDALAKYLSQLAAKQARVVELKEEQARVAADLKAAEADLQRFQEDGRQFASLVGSPGKDPKQRTSSDSGDVLERIGNQIGSQFWSFVEDVRSATMGSFNPEDEDSDGNTRELNPRRSVQNFVEEVRRRSRSPVNRTRSRQDGRPPSVKSRSPRLNATSPRLNPTSPRLPSPSRSHERDVSPPRLPQRPGFAEKLPPPQPQPHDL